MKLNPQPPLVSIGLPVFNGEATIARTIDSLLQQDYSNFEIVVSDNGSTDATPSIVEELSRQNPKISFHRSSENHGLTWNFNRVFELSRGEYFMWASHDDEHTKDYISRCLALIQNRPTVALCAPRTLATLGENHSNIWVSSLKSFKNKTQTKSRYLETLKNFPAVALYGIYRASFVKETNMFPNVVGGDLLFIQNLSFYGDIVGIDDILFTYHQRERWNTVSQDYEVFLGKSPKPFWYSPFLVVCYWQHKIIFRSSLRTSLKCQLILILFRRQSVQLFQKIGLKLLKGFIPKAKRSSIAYLIYWKFLHNPNIEVLDSAKYEKRVIRPVMHLNP